MDKFGVSGVIEHWQSTALGILALLAAAGLITQETCSQIMTQLPAIGGGVAAVLGIVGIFYKGKKADPVPCQVVTGTAGPAAAAGSGPEIINDKGEEK